MASIARQVAGIRVLGGTQMWQPLAKLLIDSLSTAPEVLREAPPPAAVPSMPFNHQDTSGVTVRKVVDYLLPGKSCFSPSGLASGTFGRELNVTCASLVSRQLTTLADDTQPAESSKEIEGAGLCRNDVTRSDGAVPLGATKVHQPIHAGSTQSLHSATSSSAGNASSSGAGDGVSVKENEDEVGSLTARERANTAPAEGEEEEEQLERTLAELAREQGGLLPAGERQEKDPDPEREYFHVLKLEEIKRILETVRGRDIEVMYVREKCNFTDYMVVVTGRSERHIRAMAEAVVRELSRKCHEIMEGLTPAVEGEPGQEWLLVDAGNIIVHFFTEDERHYYKIEELWGGQLPKKKQYGPYGELLE